VRFCDGRGYVLDKKNDQSACFASHAELAAFLADHARAVFRKGHTGGGYGRIENNIWETSGMFDSHRDGRIARAQRNVLSKLFPPSNGCQPPRFVRPGEARYDKRQLHLFDLVPDRPRPKGDARERG
jgi:hypothetical protein